MSYDANGNATANGAYDVENRLVTAANGDRYSYDPNGKRVVKRWADGSGGELYFYGITGQKLGTYTCITYFSDLYCGLSGPQYNVYFKGKLVKSKGVVAVTDRLGSVRGNGNGEAMSYYPYGEERTSTADGREKFGTYMRDSASQDYANNRYYGVGTGRFNVPDPYTASGGPAVP